MSNLQQVLTDNNIDTTTLKPWRETDRGIVWTMQWAGGDEAIALWHRLRSLVATTGHWPVILGSDEEMPRHEDAFEMHEGESVTAALEAAGDLTASDVFEARMEDASELLVDPDVDEDWPEEAQPMGQFQIPFEILSGAPHPQVQIALVPTPTPWEVPAFLQVGGWNECPSPAEHCAIMRYWHETYGAEPVGISGDTIEMHVPRPPTDRLAAFKLATEQYIYCIDIVEQGVGSIAALAAALLDGNIWYFWWD